jgi:hypothetical protein
MRGVLDGVLCLGFGVLLGGACRQSSTEAPQGIVDGYWQGSCQAHTMGSTSILYLFQSASTVERTDQMYRDKACQERVGTVTFTGDYHIFTTAQDYTYAIEMSLQKVTAVPDDATSAAFWSQQQFCGQAVWTAGELQDIGLKSADGCPSLGLVPIDYRDLILLENRPSLLVFGSHLNHGEPRPLTVDRSRADASFSPAGH